MREYYGTVSSIATGEPVYKAQVQLLKADTTPAQLYSDNGVTAITQPVLTDGSGLYKFFVADGIYTRVVADPNGANPRSFFNIEIYEDARGVTVPVGELGVSIPALGARKGKLLGFDPVTGDPVLSAATSESVDDIVSNFVITNTAIITIAASLVGTQAVVADNLVNAEV